MTLNLARNSPGEILRELVDHEPELRGLLVVAFTPDGFLTWGMSGHVSVTAMQVAVQILNQQLAQVSALAVMPVEGRA